MTEPLIDEATIARSWKLAGLLMEVAELRKLGVLPLDVVVAYDSGRAEGRQEVATQPEEKK